MKTSTVVWSIIVILIIGGLVWYFSSSSNTLYPNQTGTTTTTQSAGTPSISVASVGTLGNYLTAQNGMTLYVYANDTPGVSNCTDTCASTWPAYSVANQTTLVSSIDATGTLSTITRGDGTVQVTYNGMPLYFYSGDASVGDTNGNGVGGVWSVARP